MKSTTAKTESGASTELTGEPMYSVLERGRGRGRRWMQMHGMPGGFHRRGREDGDSSESSGEDQARQRLVPGMTAGGDVCEVQRSVCREERIVRRGACTVSVRMIPLRRADRGVDGQRLHAARSDRWRWAEVFGKGDFRCLCAAADSIPDCRRLCYCAELGVPTVMMGFGLPDDNLHAPKMRNSALGEFSSRD